VEREFSPSSPRLLGEEGRGGEDRLTPDLSQYPSFAIRVPRVHP
jgi:hypothetical protein